MSIIKDTYKTLTKPTEASLFKDKKSKFLGYAFPVTNEEEIKACLIAVKKEHNSARHHCYAWQLGATTKRFRVNDDGEPGNTAGQPIYGQIQAFDVTNVLIVSVRYSGGIKLGVGGLINAYRTSAKLALEAAEIIEKTVDVSFQLNFGYDMMNKVQLIIKEKNITILTQKLELACEYVISIRKSEAETVYTTFDTLFKVEIKELA